MAISNYCNAFLLDVQHNDGLVWR